MFSNKKGVDLSINIIIIAVAALIALIVLIAIFSGQTRKTVSTLESCEGIGGQCRYFNDCLSGEVEKFNSKCETGICCIKIYEDKNDRFP